jgi:hypothetical protein
VLLFVGGKGLVWVVGDTRTALDSKSWVSAPAIVESSTPEQSEVSYRFRVNGREYVGNRLDIPARRTASVAYAPGAQIQIIYDPLDPTQSVVNRPAVNYWFTLGIGAISLCLVIAALYLAYITVAPRKDVEEGEVEDENDEEEEPERVSAAGNVWKSIANRIDIVVIAVLLALAWGVKKLDKIGFGGTVYNVVIVVTVITILVASCVYALRKQKRVTNAFGLVCKHCGHSPRASRITDTQLRGECLKCGKPLREP